MAISPTELQRKVQQLDNDVQSIYELLSGIEGTQRRHSNRFREIAEQIGSLDSKVDGIDTKVGALDSKVDGIDTKVGSLGTKVDSLETKFGVLDTKLDEALRLLRGEPDERP